MAHLDRLNEDLKSALKSKDETAVSTLRFLIAKIHNAKIAKGEELSDEEIIAEIGKEAKRHKESIDAFEKGGRAELVAREKAELEIIYRYLPKQIPKEEIEKVVDQVISELGEAGPRDIGKVIGAVMAKVRGQADGALVSTIVREKLSE
ncbi:GatB/YqeY domain-containing protein [Candidatus Curtissbacteria bacterium]|nr:GatB/YqeY domain-containing protein [Candidatus Curtissbacteria bacterium]